MKKNKWILPSIMILLLIIATVTVSFAAFTFSKEGTVENTLETSTIMLTYTEGKTGIMLNEAYPISDEKGKVLTGENNVFDFTVSATLGKSTVIGYEVTAVKIPITDVTPLEDNEVKLYLERAVDPDTTYQEVFAPSNFVPRDNQTELGSPIGSMILDSGSFVYEGTTIHNYCLRMWIDESAKIPSGETRKYGIKINVYAKQDIYAEPVEQSISKTNLNIKKVFTYNQETGSDTFCVTGEEDTCVSLKVAPTTYPTGTIIKYKVNDNEEKYFHVVSDNGSTLTLQQRENLIYGTEWYADDADNTKGPLTILPVLENATSGWTNVLNQTYTMGTTVFKDNAYTGCDYDSTNKKFNCTTNTYTLEERTSKARMITVQEAHGLGCLKWEKDKSANGSCPIWMYNYLDSSTSYGGTVDEIMENNQLVAGYWTMNAESSNSFDAWRIIRAGSIDIDYLSLTQSSYYGTRPVVVIQK